MGRACIATASMLFVGEGTPALPHLLSRIASQYFSWPTATKSNKYTEHRQYTCRD